MKEEEWREQQRKRKAEQRSLVSRRQAFATEHKVVLMSEASAPAWAKGCGDCDFGVIGMEHATGAQGQEGLDKLLASYRAVDIES